MTASSNMEQSRKTLRETSRAAVAADEIHLAEAVESVGWERRGLLQALTRVRSRPAGDADRAA
jgi:hypothetical protein